MLILSRHNQESILIGDCVTVRVIEIVGDHVRLGVEAPGEVPVHREEVYQAIRRENGRARKIRPTDVASLRSKTESRRAG